LAKRSLMAAAFGTLLLVTGAPAEEAAPADAASAELAALACEAGQAYARKDLAALESLTADDYMQTDVRGGVLDRKAWLEFVKNRESVLTISCDDIAVRRYGETSVVTGGWTYRSRRAEEDVVTRTRWTSVWTRDGGSWKRHLFQNTYVNSRADRCAMRLPH
jgi:ketosteroid isomerase-like protein